MKKVLQLLLLAILIQACSSNALVVELDNQQSMIMTGKGPGQDATINPYDGQDCIAIVKNVGERTFSIRIQRDGEVLETMDCAKGEKREITLLAGNELYLDPNPEGPSKAKVDYKRMKKVLSNLP